MINLLFFYLSASTLVSANPLAKLLLQANQNGFKNLPMHASNIQPYMSSNNVQNPVNYCPCNKPYGSQSGFPVQIKLDDNNQSYLNKILNNPVFQNILNPDSYNYNHNSQNFGSPTNPGQAPNIINNYYIIPSECLKESDNAIDVVKNIIGNQAVCQSDGKLRKQPRSENKPTQEIIPQKRKSIQNTEEQRKVDNSKPKRDKNRNRKRNGNKRTNNNSTQNNNRTVSRKKVEGNDGTSSPNKNNVSREKSPTRKNGNKKRRKHKNETGKDTDKPIDTISIDNDTLIQEQPKETKRKVKKKQSPRYHTDEDVIKDIHKKFPGIPEDVIKRLLRYLRRQFRNHQLDNIVNIKNESESKKLIKDRTERNQISQNNTLQIDKATENALPTTTDSLVTQKSPITTENTEIMLNQDKDITKYEPKNEERQTPQHTTEIIETTTSNYVHTPNKESHITDNENDYFPDFRFDKMYMSEDDYVINLRDNRFFYTTDRNYDLHKGDKQHESSEIFYEPFKPDTKKIHSYSTRDDEKIEDTIKSPNEDIENYDDGLLDDYVSEEIEFQSPPILEHPDFETKPIKYFDEDKPIYSEKDKYINEKSSTYSDAKSISTSIKNKPKNDNIETVFAGSRVATYGQPPSEEKNDHFEHDDTVYVYAKSVATSR